MKRTILFLCVGLLGGCSDKYDRHLVCKDNYNVVVVDTTDLYQGPIQYETAWSWTTSSDGTYHEISVPPHLCTYEARLIRTKALTQSEPVFAERPAP